MKTIRAGFIFLFFVGCLALVGCGSKTGTTASGTGAGSREFTGTRWQYTVISIIDENFERDMNRLGAQGWEVVSARRATDVPGISYKYSYEMILKRPYTGEMPVADAPEPARPAPSPPVSQSPSPPSQPAPSSPAFTMKTQAGGGTPFKAGDLETGRH